MASPEGQQRRRGHVYGRRKGPKLSTHQDALMRDLLPKLTLNIEQGLDPKRYFQSPPPWGEADNSPSEFRVGESAASTRPPPGSLRSPTSPQGGGDVQDVWLEIGFGAGEHLFWQAQHNPRIGLIGAEPFINGVAKLLAKIEEDSVDNVRIHCEDARDIISALPDACIGRVFILFPDPWPKLRHHKRRFMKSGAELRFGSDDAPLVEYTLERLMAHPAFIWLATSAQDWRTRPPDWPQTRYEAKQLHGVPVFLKFSRL
jgi:tRNA (guanine-N7-)-methyltransferase